MVERVGAPLARETEQVHDRARPGAHHGGLQQGGGAGGAHQRLGQQQVDAVAEQAAVRRHRVAPVQAEDRQREGDNAAVAHHRRPRRQLRRRRVGVPGEAREVALEVGLHYPDERLGACRRLHAETGLVGNVVVVRDAARHCGRHAQEGVRERARPAGRHALLRQQRLTLLVEPGLPRQNQAASPTHVRAQLRQQRLVHRRGFRHQHHPVAVQGRIRSDHVELLLQLLQGAGGAEPGGARVVAQLRIHHQRDLAVQHPAGNERLARLHVRVHAADQLVYRRLRHAARMQQVADAAGHALTERLAALVLERRRRLEAGVVAPALEEAPGVGQRRQAERAHVAGHVGEVSVAPAAGRQRLDLHPPQVLLLHVQVGLGPRVVPDPEVIRALARLLHQPREPLHVGQRHLACVAVAVLGDARVQVAFHHSLDRPARHARLVPAHVQEDAVHRRVQRQHLLNLLGQVVLVRAGHVQYLPAGVQRLVLVGREVARHQLGVAAVRLHGQPLGMGVGGVLVDLAGDVDRRADPGAVQRLDLRPGQVEAGRQVGVPAGVIGAVVGVAVMAGAEHGHAVDVRLLEGARELLGVEVGAHAGHVGAGVKVEVDGAKRKGELWHGGRLSEPARTGNKPATTFDARSRRLPAYPLYSALSAHPPSFVRPPSARPPHVY